MSATANGGTNADELRSTYDGEFYDDLDDQVRASAAVIAPLVMQLLHPSSILDVGCGRGTWLHTFADLGVHDVVGVDGPHVATADLEIPPATFLPRDLREPFDLGRRFDLVMSLEVAEHLPPDCASAFVDSLTRHADAVLFSAAIPFQGGAGHINERWQSQWAAEFERQGFVAIDAIRPVVWRDPQVAFWYAQNTLLYAREVAAGAPAPDALAPSAPNRLDVVHPDQYIRLRTEGKRVPPLSLSRILRELPGACRRTVVRRFGSGGGRSQ